MMNKQLVRIAPLKAGVVLGTLYAVLSLLVAPLMLIFVIASSAHGGDAREMGKAAGIGIGMVVAMPFMYGVLGFLGGVVLAFAYNVITKFTGGLEFTVRDVSPGA